MEHPKQLTNPVVYADSDDDLMPTNSSKPPSNDSESGDDLMTFDKVGRPLILSMLLYLQDRMCYRF